MRRFLGWGVLVLLVLALVAGTYFSGWLMAWRLGLPLERIGAFDYWRYLAAYADAPQHGPVIKSSGLVGFGVPLLALAALALAVLLRRKPSLYGEARFATMADLRSRKMLRAEDTALVVGKKDGQFVYFNGQQFALLAAPTRSGKGVGIGIPNLLSYHAWVVVLEIKQDNLGLDWGFPAALLTEMWVTGCYKRS